MREIIKDMVAIAARTLPIEEPIYEFGSLQVPGQEGFADLRPFFPGKKYVGTDMREGIGVDMLLNLHKIELSAESVGTAICLDTLEHVECPHRALSEIHRVLKPNGIAVISSVMDFPIHDHPYDYWRFTPEAFRTLLKPFTGSFIGYSGKEDFPHTVIGVGFKGTVPELSAFYSEYKKWKNRHDKPHNRLRQTAILLTPPILVPLLRRIHNIACRVTRRID